MQPTNQEKINQCILDAQGYFNQDVPRVTIEYNFEEEPEEVWFQGFPHRFNEKCEKNSAKFTYGLS
jgi:hypothetical protein